MLGKALDPHLTISRVCDWNITLVDVPLASWNGIGFQEKPLVVDSAPSRRNVVFWRKKVLWPT